MDCASAGRRFLQNKSQNTTAQIKAGLWAYKASLMEHLLAIGVLLSAKSGGYMPSDSFYARKKHRDWREKVLKRAGYLCQECSRYGRRTPATHAHHIKPRKEYPELQYSLSNGMALCTACHNKLEPRQFS